ncbi:MAG: type II secretion system protein M, partial [Gammaproteobacteria bacterium]|nr:type II secretion system protein M [Gammaproteobacteria bacterium]
MLSTLRPLLERTNEAFEQRSIRERVVITLVAVLVLYATVFFVLIEPVDRDIAASRAQAEQSEKQISFFEEQIVKLKETPLTPEQVKKVELQTSLKNQVATLNKELTSYTNQLISPREMRAVLKELVFSDTKKVVTELENLEPEPVQAVVKQAATEKPTQNRGVASKEAPKAKNVKSVELYKHSARVVVVGEYQDIVNYLIRLEKL